MLTTKQIEQRKGLITSSRIYDVAQGHYHLVWRDMKGLSTFTGNDDTERGDELEGAVRRWSARKLLKERGMRLRALSPAFRKHPKHEWAGDSCDVAYYSNVKLEMIGEIKTAAEGVARQYGDEGTDAVPDRALFQSHWHLLHYPEVDTCVVPALLGGFKFGLKLFYVQRDPEFAAMLIEAAERFYKDYILPDREPPADGTNSTTEWFKSRYPSGNGQLIAATPGLVALAREYKNAKTVIKQLEERARAAQNQLLAAIGENAGAEYDGVRITLSDVEETTYTATRKAYRMMRITGV